MDSVEKASGEKLWRKHLGKNYANDYLTETGTSETLIFIDNNGIFRNILNKRKERVYEVKDFI